MRAIHRAIDFGNPMVEVSAEVRGNWQREVRRLIGLMAAHDTAYTCRSADLEIVVLPQVFSPAYFTDSEWFATEIAKLAAGRRLLDIGTGTGIVALVAARAGANVTATDINPYAVANAQQNFAVLELSAEIVEGDVYAAIAPDAVFDVVFWNHPFNLGKNPDEDLLSLCGFDYEYRGIRKFIGEARPHLAPGGRLVLGSSTFAEVGLIEQIAKENKFDVDILARRLTPLQWKGEAVTELRICEFKSRV